MHVHFVEAAVELSPPERKKTPFMLLEIKNYCDAIVEKTCLGWAGDLLVR